MDSMFTLGVVLSAKDMLSPVIGKAGKSVGGFGAKIEAISGKLALLGTASYAAGRTMLSPVMSTVEAYQELAKAQGDLASLGIGTDGIDAITRSAKKMSNQFADVTANEFVKASYDIKSGIASLTDEGVAKFTELSAMTAQATKSSTEEMTKLFALSYGIFKKESETDFDFGERVSAQMAQAVKSFRTDGSDLTLGISNIGAAAKKMGVSLSEELSIIGVAKSAFNTAAEAGTGYRAFLVGVGKAQKKLGLTFTDAEGKMLPMVDILNKIKEKYGDNIDSLEAQQELMQAFGSSEAVKMVNALIDKTDELTSAQKDLNNATLDNVEAMAKARNKGKEYDLLRNKMINLSTTIGQMFAPVVGKLASVIGSVIQKIQTFTQEHKTATKYIAYGVAAFGALLTVAGAVLIPLSGIGMMMPSLALGIKAVGGAFGFMTTAIKFAARALLMNPIGLTITAIAAGAYLIYRNWGSIKEWFGRLWSGVKNIFASAWGYMKKAFAYSPIGLIAQGIGKAIDWIGEKVGGFGNFFKKTWGYMKKAFEWSPFGVIKKAYSKVFEWLGSKFEWFGDAVKKIKGFSSKIASWFGFGRDKEGEETQKTSKIEPAKAIKRAAVATAVTAQVAAAQPAQLPSAQVQQSSLSTTYSITINVNGGDEKKIAQEVRRAIMEIEDQKRNRQFSDEVM